MKNNCFWLLMLKGIIPINECCVLEVTDDCSVRYRIKTNNYCQTKTDLSMERKDDS